MNNDARKVSKNVIVEMDRWTEQAIQRPPRGLDRRD